MRAIAHCLWRRTDHIRFGDENFLDSLSKPSCETSAYLATGLRQKKQFAAFCWADCVAFGDETPSSSPGAFIRCKEIFHLSFVQLAESIVVCIFIAASVYCELFCIASCKHSSPGIRIGPKRCPWTWGSIFHSHT